MKKTFIKSFSLNISFHVNAINQISFITVLNYKIMYYKE